MVYFLFALQLSVASSVASAQTFLDFAETSLFNPATAPRIGLEVELTGLTQQEIGEELQKTLGGTLRWVTIMEENLNSQTRKIETYPVHELHLVNSSMVADVIIKPEDNVTENADMAELKARTRIYEIVTPPIRYEQAIPLQAALESMQLKGAQGTQDGHAVAIQVNVEMGEGDPKKISAVKILTILRNYLKPEHRESIAYELQAPAFRQMYLGLYTPGMMSRILDMNYRPSNKRFFFDFMYRQSLELFGVREAWIMPEAQARKKLQSILEQRPFDEILPVVKWNYIRASAVLMFLYPKDWLSRYLHDTTWFHQYPILEFREANSDFLLLKRIKQFLGIVQYSETHGDIVWLEGMSQLQCRQLFAK